MTTPSTQTPPADDTCTILEVSTKQHVTWTMPRSTYEQVTKALDNWRYVFGGRQPKATVERVLDLFARAGWPQMRDQVTRSVRPAPEEAIRGHKATFQIHDTLPLTE